MLARIRHAKMELRPVRRNSTSCVFTGECVELVAHYAIDGAEEVGFELRDGAVRHRIAIDLRARTLSVLHERVALPPGIDARDLVLRAFIDRSLVEVFVGARISCTAVLRRRAGGGALEILPLARGGSGTARVECFTLADIGVDD